MEGFFNSTDGTTRTPRGPAQGASLGRMAAKAKRPRTKGIELVSSKLIYKGPAFSVYQDFVREGEFTGQRDVVRHTGSVVIAAVDDTVSEPKVLLVRQYRYAADQYMWELPAGRIDEGEQALPAARRELLEETGIRAKKWKRLFRFYASPGFLDETMDVFLATALEQGKAEPEEDEQIEARFFPLSRGLKLVRSGEIQDAKTMSALLFLTAWPFMAHLKPT
jgi:ADP-ribose pyrophosphatase